MGQFGIQHGCLNTIQTAVDADYVVVIANTAAMIGNRAYPFSQVIVISKNSTAVPVAAQVLGRKERCTTDSAHCARLTGLSVGERVLRSNRLTCIFDNVQMMQSGKLRQRLHVRTLTEKMYGYNRFGLRSDGASHGLYIHVHSLPIYVH